MFNITEKKLVTFTKGAFMFMAGVSACKGGWVLMLVCIAVAGGVEWIKEQ